MCEIAQDKNQLIWPLAILTQLVGRALEKNAVQLCYETVAFHIIYVEVELVFFEIVEVELLF